MTQQTPEPPPWPTLVFGPQGAEITVETRHGDEFEGTHEHLIAEGSSIGWLVVKYEDEEDGRRFDRHVAIPLADIRYADWTAPAEPEKPAEEPKPGDATYDESDGEDVLVAALPMSVGQRIRFAVGTADGEELVDGTLIGVGRSAHPGHQRVVVARQEGADRAYNLADDLSVRVG